MRLTRRERLRLIGLRIGNVLRDLGVDISPRAYLVYRPGYVSSIREASMRETFDIRRPARIVEKLYAAHVLNPAMVLTPEAVSLEELQLVHTPKFLEDVQLPERLAGLLSLTPETLSQEPPLRPFLLQTGGTVLAAARAVETRLPVINLGGGYHHAQRDRAEGFCPINDVAVAIRLMQKRRMVERVLVVDLDYHHGNGTALIFSEDEDVFTLSIHARNWAHVQGKRNNLDVELPAGVRDEVYLRAVRAALEQALGRFQPDLGIYLAGADAWAGDSLGDFAVSEDGMLDRDLYVHQTLLGAGIPLCVVLAGGYGPLSWTVPYNYIFSVLTGVRIPPSMRPANIEAEYRRLRHKLTAAQLQIGAGELSDMDLDGLFQNRSVDSLFMGYYTCEGLQIALEHYGFLDLLRERGFQNLLFSMDTSDRDRQVFRIHFDQTDADHLLVELVVRFRTLISPEAAVAEGAETSYRMLSIEWLTMQNPLASFTLDRRMLPGQRYPGLGVGRWLVELLRMMAERLDCAGLMNIPRHYHNAVLYSKQMLCFYPEDQGRLEAMKRDLHGLPLVETSLQIEDGKLRQDGSDEPVLWEGKPQVMPIRPGLNAYFARAGYIQAVARMRDALKFHLVE